jgi:hypothetical protein
MREKEVARFKGVLATSRLTHSPFSPATDLVDRTEALSAEVLEHKKKSRMSHGYVFLQRQ